MEGFKKIWRLLTNPSLNLIRVLAVVALVMVILLFLFYVSNLISVTRERNRYMAKYQDSILKAERPSGSENKPEPATFSVNEAKKIGNIIIIDVTIRNLSDQKIYFAISDFKLKDQRLMLCGMTIDANLLEKEKKSALSNAYLLPKEELRGVIMFRCTDPTVKIFTLRFQDAIEKVVPEDITETEIPLILQIPSMLLEQKFEKENIPITTQLVEWRLSSEEEAKVIAESFIKNSEDRLGVSFNDLKLQRLYFGIQRDYDYHNPHCSAMYKQYYHEIPVYDGYLGIAVNAYGVIYRAGNALKTNITAPTKPTITSEAAIEILKKRYNITEFNLRAGPELYILNNKLVWRLDILGPVWKEVFVDAQAGDIVLERSNVRTAP